LKPGVVTRYVRKQDVPYDPAGDSGRYVSRGDVSFEQRSLLGKESDYTKETFVVKKPVRGKESKATPWFDKKGAGNQVEFKKSVGDMVKENYGDSLLNALIKLVSVMHDSTYFALFTNPVYVCL